MHAWTVTGCREHSNRESDDVCIPFSKYLFMFVLPSGVPVLLHEMGNWGRRASTFLPFLPLLLLCFGYSIALML